MFAEITREALVEITKLFFNKFVSAYPYGKQHPGLRTRRVLVIRDDGFVTFDYRTILKDSFIVESCKTLKEEDSSFAQAVATFLKDSLVAAHSDKLVGHPYGAGRRTGDSWLYHFLWQYANEHLTTLPPVAKDVDILASELERELACEWIHFRELYYISHCDSPGEVLHLEPELRLVCLTQAQMVDLWNSSTTFEELYPASGLHTLIPQLPVSYIECNFSLRKVVVDNDLPAPDPELDVFPDFTRRVQDHLKCLKIASRAPITLLRRHTLPIGVFISAQEWFTAAVRSRDYSSDFSSTRDSKITVPRHTVSRVLSINEETIALVDQVKTSLFDTSLSKSTALLIAASRIERGIERLLDEDAWIDYGIALESMILSGKDGKNSTGEVVFRFATRTAWFLGDDQDHRVRLFIHVKKMYDLRSMIVHGRKVDSEKGKLAELEDLVHNVLLKFIAINKRPEDIDWNTITFGQ